MIVKSFISLPTQNGSIGLLLVDGSTVLGFGKLCREKKLISFSSLFSPPLAQGRADGVMLASV